MKKSGFAKGVIWTLSIGIVLVVILAAVGIVAYNGYTDAALEASYSTGKSKTTINIEKKKKTTSKYASTELSDKTVNFTKDLVKNKKKLKFKEYGPFYGIKKNGIMVRGIHKGPKGEMAQTDYYGLFTKNNMFWKGYSKHNYNDGIVLYQYNEYKLDDKGIPIQDKDGIFQLVDSYVISADSFEKVKEYIHYDIELPFSFYDFEEPQTQIAKVEPSQTQKVAEKKNNQAYLCIFRNNTSTNTPEDKMDIYEWGTQPGEYIIKFVLKNKTFNKDCLYKVYKIKNKDIYQKLVSKSVNKSFFKKDNKTFYNSRHAQWKAIDEFSFNKIFNSQTQIQNVAKTVKFKTDEKYYALIIGNNNYEHLEKLDAAENDAKVLANVLQDKYGFEVDLLLNADYDTTVNSLFKITNKLKSNDNLLIYYAGHGELDKAENRGYWLPVDASYELRSKWISNQRIVDRVKATKAKHVLLMVDSCFSGTLMRSGTTPEVKETIDEKYIERLKKKKTRLVITSGGEEPVVDSDGGQHSLFALKLIDTLKNNKTVINSQILFENIRRYVVVNADQTPERAIVHKTGDDGGDFLFFAKN